VRVLQLVHKPQRRGAEIFAHQLSVALERGGDDVRIVYLYDAHGSYAIPVRDRDCVLGTPERSVFERMPGVHPRAVGALRRIVREFVPEVIQVNGGRTVKYGAYAKALRFTGDAVLIYRNIGNPSDWLRGRWHRLLYQRIVMRQLDAVVGVSRATLHNVRQTYGIEVPMRAIPNAIAPEELIPQREPSELRAQASVPADAQILVWVGQFSREKRVDRLFDVLVRLRANGTDARLWLVGGGPLEAELRQQAHRAGVKDSTTFWGPSDDVASYVAAADLFVLPSDSEGVPGVILEAGYLRRPTVAMDVGGVAECIRDGETGVLVPSGELTRMAEAVQELLRDEERRLRMGSAARALVERDYLVDGIARRYRGFYLDVRGRRVNPSNV
jgi:glycosyltransferase involved in cell wall biosynthesis